eukprot:48013_1
MVNLINIMTKPYMMAGNLAKNAICGVGDLVDGACSRSRNRGLCCGAGDLLDDLNPCHRDTTDGGRDDSLNIFGGGAFSGKNTKFEECSWNQLPGRCKDAARTLGVDQSSWDGKGWTSREEMWWEDLSSDQRDAAMTLGWDESAWDSQYEDKDWGNLPGAAQKAAESLGFNSQTWAYGEWPAVSEKYWEQMSSDEQKALYVLGYYKYNWE